MIYVRKNIPRTLKDKIWYWCCDTLEIGTWKTYEPVNHSEFSVHFDKEEDFVWFTLKWEDSIQNEPRIKVIKTSSWKMINLLCTVDLSKVDNGDLIINKKNKTIRIK